MRWLKNNFRGERGERIPHDFLNTLANFWNFFSVIGGTVQRRSDGRLTIKIDESFPVDTDGYDAAKNPDGRMTLEQNPETYNANDDSHTGERQLRNVQNVLERSSSVPFFVSTVLQGTGSDKIVGELYWAQVDSKRYSGDPGYPTSPYRSIDITNDFSDTTKGKWNLGLYGFANANQGAAAYCMGTGNRTLTWQYPAMIDGNPRIGVSPTPFAIITQLTSTSYGGGTSVASLGVKATTAEVLNGTVDFKTYTTTFNQSLYVYVSPEDVNARGKHDSFSDTSESLKHDWRYLHRNHGTARPRYDNYAALNICDSIAFNTAGYGAINFYTMWLLDGLSRGSVGYGARTLLNQSTQTTVDWDYRFLNGGWTIGFPLAGGPSQGATVLVSEDTSPFMVSGGSSYPQIKAYHTSPDLLPRTEIRGLRLYARNSTSVYFDLEIEDGVLIFRDHTGANCGEIRRSL